VHYALDRNGIRIPAQRHVEATCPCCGEPVVARCGELVQWHWAHRQRQECDAWFEPETPWHRAWKALAPAERVEVPFGPHRADIVGHDDTVVELQHSGISPEEIRDREAFYGRMVWLLDGSAFRGNFRVARSGSGFQFHWAHARPSWLAARKYLFVHGFTLGTLVQTPSAYGRRIEPRFHPLAERDDIFQILSISRRAPHVGTGRIVPVATFIERLIALAPADR
jgi:hypothetical protein